MSRGTRLPELRPDIAGVLEPAVPRGVHSGTTTSADLRIRGLGARYGSQVALHGVDLDVSEGTCVAVLGANGAGKTTLLNAISGVHRPVVGEIHLGDRDLALLRAPDIFAAGVCHIPEGRGVFASLSVADNLRVAVDDDELEVVFARFPRLRERLGQRAGTLSGGEQQMLALAPALVGNYRLLLVDEVSLGLAPVVVDAIFAVLAEIRGRGGSIVLVEQFAERALELADRAYVLRKGEVVFAGTAAELRGDDELLHRLYLGG